MGKTKGSISQLSAGFWWAIGTAIAYGLLMALAAATISREPAASAGQAAMEGGASCSLSSPWA